MKIQKLRPALVDYEIFPHVVLLGKEFDYTARGLGMEAELNANEEYIIRIIPQEDIATARTLEIGDENCYHEIKTAANDKGILHFSYTLTTEQIYTFRPLKQKTESIKDFVISVFLPLKKTFGNVSL